MHTDREIAIAFKKVLYHAYSSYRGSISMTTTNYFVTVVVNLEITNGSTNTYHTKKLPHTKYRIYLDIR